MANYNIEIEIQIDEEIVRVDSTSGDYLYDLDSIEGGNVLSKILYSDVQVTVYAQGKTFNSIDEYNEWKESQ